MASAVCTRFLLQRSTHGFLFSSRARPTFFRYFSNFLFFIFFVSLLSYCQYLTVMWFSKCFFPEWFKRHQKRTCDRCFSIFLSSFSFAYLYWIRIKYKYVNTISLLSNCWDSHETIHLSSERMFVSIWWWSKQIIMSKLQLTYTTEQNVISIKFVSNIRQYRGCLIYTETAPKLLTQPYQ